MSNFLLIFFGIISLSLCQLIQPNITNSSGHYYLIINIDNVNVDASSSSSDASSSTSINYPLINCTSDIFCYIKCYGTAACYETAITIAKTPRIEINCIGYHSCAYSTMKLIQISEITLNCLDIDSCFGDTIHTELSTNINILCQGCDESIFYLTDEDQQSGEIIMECQSCKAVEIYGKKGNIESFKMICSGHNQCSSTYLYCPYQNDDICQISCKSEDGSCGIDFQIIVPYIEINTEFLKLIDYKYGGDQQHQRINVYCNSNTAKFSSTYIVNDTFTQNIECKNITSECCPFTRHRVQFDCVSIDPIGESNICRINCSNANCINHNILSTSKLVDRMEIICGENDCYNTIINCPNTENSQCNVTCDYQQSSCYKTVIKYNENNQDINLFCDEEKSCYGLQVYGTMIDADNANTTLLNANIRCTNSFSCADANFIFHGDYNRVYILCTTTNPENMGICNQTRIYFWSSNIQKAIVNCTAPSYNENPICLTMDINSRLNDDFSLICMKDSSCKDINITPRYDEKNSTYILCNTGGDCENVNILIPSTNYMHDYLVTGTSRDCSAIEATCGRDWYSTKLKSDCSCGEYGFMCCPFLSNSTHLFTCNTDDCVINCGEILCNQLLVNADGASQSVTFICSEDDGANGRCNMVKLFASTVAEVNFNCTNCQNISIFAEYASRFNMICDNCVEIFVDVNQAQLVEIDAKSFSKGIIYGINASSFNIICQESSELESSCNELKLYVPSSNTGINCFEYSCNIDIEIYAYNGMLSLTDLSLFTCGNCFSYNGCIQNWEIFCGDEFAEHTTFFGGNCSDHNEYCNCQEFFDNGYDKLIDGVKECADDYVDYEPIVPLALGWIFAIILFIIIVIFLYGICRGYICQCIDKEFKEHESVHPPKLYKLSYIHGFDGFLWIIQWFNVARIIIFYNEWHDVCSGYYAPGYADGVKELCNANFHCTYYINNSNECGASTTLFVLYVYILCVITIAGFLELCRIMTIIAIGCRDNMELNEYRIRLLSNSVFLRLFQIPSWKDHFWISIIHEYFYTRKMFGFMIHQDSLIITYYIIRYLAYFGGTLAFYGIYYSDPASLRWWEVIPVIIVWIFNEVLLIPHYKLMPPYDEHKHCVWIIYKIYGEIEIAEYIMDYVGINYCPDGEDSIRWKKYSAINKDSDDEREEEEMHHLRDDSYSSVSSD